MNRILGTAATLAVIGSGTVYGDLQFDLSVEFSGAVAPDGAGPYLRATFEDVPGGVELTLTSLLIGSTEFVDEWYFNLDPALDPTLLSVAYDSGGPAATSVMQAVDSFKADGDGLYDLRFDFANAPPTSRFNGSDSVSYLITSSESISAASFDYLSLPDGGNGPFVTAAHVLGTGNGDDSGWITVPEPATVGMLSIGLVLFAARRRA